MRDPLTDYNPELEVFEGEQQETFQQLENEVLSETEEMELASELLEVNDERALDRFLGDLIKKVGGMVPPAVASDIGGILKSVARTALPVAPGAIPNHAAWSKLGSGLASVAGRTFGLELEGLSHEDREFEAARRYVRFAGNTIKNAARAPRGADPRRTAGNAAAQAARRHAPGLSRQPKLVVNGPSERGQWVRDGRNVIIVNCQPTAAAQIPQDGQPEEDTMHDIDRTQLEADHEMENFEFENFEFESEAEGVFNEMQEMELASELMEVQNEQELEQFLGDLIKKAGSAIGKVVKSPIGQAVGGMLKKVAKTAIPMAATAVGGMFGGPLGAKIGGSLGSMTTNALGLEMESEDREFEGAKQFVRIAGQSVRNATKAPAAADPRKTAQTAVAKAVRAVAPALLQTPPQGQPRAASPAQHHARYHAPSNGPAFAQAANNYPQQQPDYGHFGGHQEHPDDQEPQSHHGHSRSGRWVRHGHKIVLIGV
jgi:uncharacterized protein (DUF697 family)